MNIKIYDFYLYDCSYEDFVESINSNHDILKINETHYKTSIHINVKGYLVIPATLRIEKGIRYTKVRCYSNLLKLFLIYVMTLILLSILLMSIYNVEIKIPVFVFTPLALLMLFIDVFIVKYKLKRKIASILNLNF